MKSKVQTYTKKEYYCIWIHFTSSGMNCPYFKMFLLILFVCKHINFLPMQNAKKKQKRSVLTLFLKVNAENYF